MLYSLAEENHSFHENLKLSFLSFGLDYIYITIFVYFIIYAKIKDIYFIIYAKVKEINCH